MGIMMPFTSARFLCVFFILTFAFKTPGCSACEETELKNGLHIQNCSNEGLSDLPKIPEHAEILDFSRNKFQQLPALPESSECHEEGNCQVKDSTNHCRLNISFSRNEIVSFHHDAFRNLSCVRNLDLSFNQIKAEIFHIAIFQYGLYNLQRLSLRGNPLGTLPDNIISMPFMFDLRVLDLSNCALKDMGKDSIDDFGHLLQLDLSYNRLTTIHPDTFKGLNRLEILDLTQNQLNYFEEHVFGDLSNLRELRLADNKISSFHPDAFYKDSNLKVLNLANNEFTDVPFAAVDKLLRLHTLDLSQNPIEFLKAGSSRSQVKHLILNNMPKLHTLNEDALVTFPGLETLTITGSRGLKTIHPSALGEDTSALKHVNLENNGLSTLASDALPWKQLSTLKLSGNPWVCDSRLEWMINALNIVGPVLCAHPAKLRGLDIQMLKSSQLDRFYSLKPLISIISLLLAIPVIGLLVYLVWKRRRFLPCVGSNLKGKYVSVFTRDVDDEDHVEFELKVNMNRLKTVSNGEADDTKPFIQLEEDTARNSVVVEDDEEEI